MLREKRERRQISYTDAQDDYLNEIEAKDREEREAERQRMKREKNTQNASAG